MNSGDFVNYLAEGTKVLDSMTVAESMAWQAEKRNKATRKKKATEDLK
jgi:hypothetical protein